MEHSAFRILHSASCTPHSAFRIPHSAPGFSLLEIVIVLAIMGLMAGALTPLALHLIGSKKAFANRDELQALKKAIIGDPLATQWGSEATFGYIGDIGSLPTSLQDLYTQPAGVPSYFYNSALRMGYGWRGPYVAEKSYSSSTESLQDPYKNTYSYSTTITTDATLGAEVRATIRSPGPNRTDDGGTQDDLTERVLTTEILADVAGIVKDSSGAAIPYLPMAINYPNAGTLTSKPSETSGGKTEIDGRYSFSSIPLGERSITLSPVLVYVPGTAYATIACIKNAGECRSGCTGPGGEYPNCTVAYERCTNGLDDDGDGLVDCKDTDCQLSEVEFQVANLSVSNITVSSIKVYSAINPATYYGQVWINGSSRANRSPKISTQANPPDGTTVSLIPAQTLSCSGSRMRREPFRVLLQSSRVEIPDIELNTIGAGETMTVKLRDFADAQTCGTPIDMSGISFKVTFSVTNCSACTTEICNNGIDDDGDGLIDCDDPDCFTDPACITEVCNNGIDDDGDGLIDCNDPDCFCNPACSSASYTIVFTPKKR